VLVRNRHYEGTVRGDIEGVNKLTPTVFDLRSLDLFWSVLRQSSGLDSAFSRNGSDMELLARCAFWVVVQFEFRTLLGIGG
jgi:hypothetical protein